MRARETMSVVQLGVPIFDLSNATSMFCCSTRRTSFFLWLFPPPQPYPSFSRLLLRGQVGLLERLLLESVWEKGVPMFWYFSLSNEDYFTLTFYFALHSKNIVLIFILGYYKSIVYK